MGMGLINIQGYIGEIDLVLGRGGKNNKAMPAFSPHKQRSYSLSRYVQFLRLSLVKLLYTDGNFAKYLPFLLLAGTG
jgi:hypothetical protein